MTDKQREAKCSNCGKEVPQTEGKRPSLYCNDACRKRMKRRTAHKLNPDIINGHPLPDSNLGQGVTKTCKYCFKQLEFAVLECCNDCAEMRSKPASPARDGHILASRPALEFTGKMTDFERERYKSASELKPGKYNPVSKPGDADYNGVCTPEWKAERSRC